MRPFLPPLAASPEPIDCETAVRRLWDYLDGRLPPSARDEVEAHLAVCEYCPPHFSFAREMQATLAASGAPMITDAEEAELRERVRVALQRLAKP
jgi:anti-sigma factor RsiW